MVEHYHETFLDIKERKFEIQPNVITADYCMKKLIEDLDSIKQDVAEYIY